MPCFVDTCWRPACLKKKEREEGMDWEVGTKTGFGGAGRKGRRRGNFSQDIIQINKIIKNK